MGYMTKQLSKQQIRSRAITRLKLHLSTSILALILIIISIVLKQPVKTVDNQPTPPTVEDIKKIKKKLVDSSKVSIFNLDTTNK